MFRNPTMQRAVAALVLTTFTSLSLYPLTAAAQAKAAIEQAGLLPQQKDEGAIGNAQRYFKKLAGKTATPELSADERFARLLNDIHEDLKAAVPEVALSREARQHAQGNFPKADIKDKAKSIRARKNELNQLYADIEQSFKDTEQHLIEAKLPQEILNRHNDAVAQFQSRKAELERLMNKIEQADNSDNGSERQAALEALGSFMAKYPNAKPHQHTDPTKLPFHTPDGKIRKPHETKEEFQASLFPPQYEKVMLASLNLDGIKLAQVTLPEVPNAQDLAETEDVQITPPIQAQAEALGKNPVKIYNWVRNNVLFTPTYGSIQGSDMTLLTKRGNAFDTASLLIALLRASGIAARYAYGTVDIPADKVMNWVGGVTKPEYAQALLGQGGIPNVALVSGGTIKAFRMEHVWVEAYVDYFPSRGAVHKTPTTWVPMDASFKQFKFEKPIDVNKIKAFDANALIAQLQQGGAVGPNHIQNLDVTKLESAYRDYMSAVDGQLIANGTNPSIDDLLGKPKVVVDNAGILMGSLPYRVVVTGSRFATLRQDLRHYAKVELFGSDLDKALDSPSFVYRTSLPALGLKRLGISYKPASAQDAQMIQDAKDNHAASLPAYLINVVPTVEVDGRAVASGSVVRMGSSQLYTVTLVNPQGLNTQSDDFKRTAGDEIVVGINSSGVSEEMVRARFTEFLNQETAAENLFQAALGYWLLSDTYDWKAAQQYGVVTHRLPSVGFFTSGLQVSYFFGIPRGAVYKGRNMDVPHVISALSGAEQPVLANFLFQSGLEGSFFEGFTFDQLFAHGVGHSVSAVQLLKASNDIGEKIYTLTLENGSAILPTLALAVDVKQDIQNALYAGKHVIVPEKELSYNRYSGVGYIIKDPETGAAAYLIDGGLNGGSECEKEPATEPAKEPLVQKIGTGILYTALLLLIIAILVATMGPFIVALGSAMAAGAMEAVSVVGAGAALVISFVALPASAANEPSPPLRRRPDGTLYPPGRCTPSQHAALEAAKDAACGPVAGSSCKKLKPDDIGCSDLQNRIKAFDACIAARQTIIFQCFESGDAGHWDQISDLQSGLGYCQALYNTKRCDDCLK